MHRHIPIAFSPARYLCMTLLLFIRSIQVLEGHNEFFPEPSLLQAHSVSPYLTSLLLICFSSFQSVTVYATLPVFCAHLFAEPEFHTQKASISAFPSVSPPFSHPQFCSQK